MIPAYKIVTECLRDCMLFGMIAYAWGLKYRADHPRELTDVAEADAEIVTVQLQKRWLWSPKENASVTIYAQYQSEDGKTRTARLATCPVRGRLDALAPELLEKGTKLRIRYERKHRSVFYFADPRYAAEEIAGQPRQPRIGYFGLTLVSLLAAAIIALQIWLVFFLPE